MKTFFAASRLLVVSTLLSCLVLVLSWSVANCEEQKETATSAPSASALTDEQIDVMNMKQLRLELKRRGVFECDDCLEKEHFRQALKKTVADGAKVLTTEEIEEQSKKLRSGKNSASSSSSGDAKKKFSADDLKGSGIDVEALKAQFRKKKEENDKMKEAMKKAGYDTSKMKFGNDNDVLEKLFSNSGDL